MSGRALHLVTTVLGHAVLWLGVIFVAAHIVRRSYRRTLALYRGTLGNPRRERLFLASLAFLMTVLVVRTITLLIHYDIGPFHNLTVFRARAQLQRGRNVRD